MCYTTDLVDSHISTMRRSHLEAFSKGQLQTFAYVLDPHFSLKYYT